MEERGALKLFAEFDSERFTSGTPNFAPVPSARFMSCHIATYSWRRPGPG